MSGENVAHKGKGENNTNEEKLFEKEEDYTQEKGNRQDSGIEFARAGFVGSCRGGPFDTNLFCLGLCCLSGGLLRCFHGFSIAELLVQYLRLESGQDGNALVSKTSGSNP